MEMIAVLIVWPLFLVSIHGLLRAFQASPVDGARNRRTSRLVALLAGCTLVTRGAFVWLCIVASQAIS